MTIHIPMLAFAIIGYITAGITALAATAWLWGRFTPSHWRIAGPMRHARPAHEVFRRVNVADGHAATLRRLLRLGPWAFYAVRYARGEFDDRPACSCCGRRMSSLYDNGRCGHCGPNRASTHDGDKPCRLTAA